MKCPFCKKKCSYPNVIHVTEINDNGNVSKVSLCEYCSQQLIPDELAIMSNSIKIGISIPIAPIVPVEFPKCKYCKISLDDIIRKGFFGCPKCYEEFKEDALTIFSYCHHASKHIGKKPKTLLKKKSLSELQELLNLAIKEERYEDAQEFKNRINDLNSEIP